MRTRPNNKVHVVKCSTCKTIMKLLLNLRNKQIYGCTECGKPSITHGRMLPIGKAFYSKMVKFNGSQRF